MKARAKKIDPDIEDMVADLPKLVPVQVAADLLSVTTRTLRTWASDGRLRVFKTARGGSGRVLVPRAELVRVLSGMAMRVPFGD
jgi:excisionase family DNA binding protein